MHDQTPDADPGHKYKEVVAFWDDDVVDGVGELSKSANSYRDNQGCVEVTIDGRLGKRVLSHLNLPTTAGSDGQVKGRGKVAERG